MSSDPSGPAFSPLYQQIKLLITRSLQEGEWKPGEAIPAETDLAARYRVSQGTVRKAIDELATENLLVRRQGKGTFVATHAEEQIQYRFLRLAPDDGKTRGMERHFIDCKRMRPPAPVALLQGILAAIAVSGPADQLATQLAAPIEPTLEGVAIGIAEEAAEPAPGAGDRHPPARIGDPP